MLPTKLLAFLRCPEDHSDLKPADNILIQQINSAIRAGLITNHAGQVLKTSIDGGLIRARRLALPSRAEHSTSVAR